MVKGRFKKMMKVMTTAVVTTGLISPLMPAGGGAKDFYVRHSF